MWVQKSFDVHDLKNTQLFGLHALQSAR